MKVYNFHQRSPEWYDIRRLKGTASNATEIIACGKGLDTLAKSLVEEYFNPNFKEYSNEHTDRGNELEPIARSIYEFEFEEAVDNVGFIEYNEYIGCSPDGLIGEDGLLEIKCPSDNNYLTLYFEEKYPKKYYNQIQMQLLITGREWCDLFIYNPNFERYFLKERVLKSVKYSEKLIKGFEKIEELIKKYKSEYEARINIT